MGKRFSNTATLPGRDVMPFMTDNPACEVLPQFENDHEWLDREIQQLVNEVGQIHRG